MPRSARRTPFSPDTLWSILTSTLPKSRRYWIAFSGGLDSHVLLHALAGLRDRLDDIELHAVHVHHGLSPNADSWAQHCVSVCVALNIPCQVFRVNAAPTSGESPEAAARNARYAALKGLMAPADGLLTAHHQEDQAETVLLQLLRGAGARGLAAMPVITLFGAGWLGRPLLDFSRGALRTYAEAQGLQWVEDESNADTGYDRNYLRHEILPRIVQRWPAAPRTLSRVASHNAEAAELLEALAQQDLGEVRKGGGLVISQLNRLSVARQRNLLRYWLHDIEKLPLPDTVHLQRILDEVVPAAEDAEPCVCWPGAEVRRYRQVLYAMPPLPELEQCRVYTWQPVESDTLLLGQQQLMARQMEGLGLRADLCEKGVEVRFRQGGERCQPVGRGHHHSLKKLLQEWGVPPWLRERVPLIYLDNELAVVVGYCVCEPFQAKPDEPGYDFSWQW